LFDDIILVQWNYLPG